MAEVTWKTLRDVLVERYDDFTRLLSRQLGSRDLAEDALQDTFLRLAREGELAPVHDPRGYLYRMAYNIAAGRSRTERRRLTVAEADTLLDLIDEAPGPEHIAAARSDLRFARMALEELPERRRAIFKAAWVENLSTAEIAMRHNLTVRMIQMELKKAAEHIAARLAESNVIDFESGLPKAS